MTTTLATPEGRVELRPEPTTGRTVVSLSPHAGVYVPSSECQSSLPHPIIRALLDLSFVDLCDVLARHEAGDVVSLVVISQLLAYRRASDLVGARILDFGCGTGASTVHLARCFPDAEVVGVELEPAFVAIAHDVLAARGVRNAQVLQSPDPEHLPPNLGTFDVIVLSAVYEHLLPAERRTLLPLLWSVLKPGGIIGITQTPYRWFPYEHHSTGLWFINYLPDRLAHWVARRFAPMYPEANRRRTWAEHLRGGLRGGTEREILRDLRRANDGRPRVLQPLDTSRAGHWLAQASGRHRWVKRLVAALFHVTDRLFGTVPSINVDVVIQKDPSA